MSILNVQCETNEVSCMAEANVSPAIVVTHVFKPIKKQGAAFKVVDRKSFAKAVDHVMTFHAPLMKKLAS